MFFRKKLKRWAIDLGKRWVKGIQLKKKNGKLYIHRLGRFVWYRNDLDVKEKMAGRIRDFWRITEFEGDEIITSVSGHSVIIKIFNLTEEDDKEDIENTLKQKIEEYIPFDVNDIYMSFETIKNPDNTVDVFLVGGQKKIIDDLKEICSLANLKLSIIDVDSFALVNCFEYNYPEYVDSNVYFLDIGSQDSIFCVYSNKRPIFIRDLNFGGDELIDRISTVLGSSFLEAEKVVLSNFRNIERDQKKFLRKLRDDQISFWADEVLRTINYFKEYYKKEISFDHMFISGGGALFPRVVEIFSERIKNLKISLFDPWKRIEYDDSLIDPKYLNSIKSQFSVVTGLALRSWS